MKYRRMTSIQLKELMKKRDIPRRSLATKKREMINLLEKDDRSLAAAFTEQPPAPVTAQRAEPEPEQEQEELQEQIESKIREISIADAKNLLQDLMVETQNEDLLIEIENALYSDWDFLLKINQWLVQPDECSHEDRLKHLVRFTTLSIAPRGLVINPAIPLTEQAPAIVPTPVIGQAISIQQPWAWAIFHLGKNVENRTWPTDIRGRVFIHASRRYNWGGAVWIEKNFGIAPPPEKELPKGAIIGSVEITDCIQKAASPWAMPNKYHFILERPALLYDPIPYRGQLKFFKTDILIPEYQKDPIDDRATISVCPVCKGRGNVSSIDCSFCGGIGFVDHDQRAYFIQMANPSDCLPENLSPYRIRQPAPSDMEFEFTDLSDLSGPGFVCQYLSRAGMTNYAYGFNPRELLIGSVSWEDAGFTQDEDKDAWSLFCSDENDGWVVFRWIDAESLGWLLSVSRLTKDFHCGCMCWRKLGNCIHTRIIKKKQLSRLILLGTTRTLFGFVIPALLYLLQVAMIFLMRSAVLFAVQATLVVPIAGLGSTTTIKNYGYGSRCDNPFNHIF